jgi:peptidyl-tRNA hydrolase
MSEGKIAAQCVHAALGLNLKLTEDPTQMLGEYLPCVLRGMESVVVLQVSDAKFTEAKLALGEKKAPFYVVTDAGYTEIAPNTETVLAYLEDDPRCSA